MRLGSTDSSGGLAASPTKEVRRWPTSWIGFSRGPTLFSTGTSPDLFHLHPH